MASSGINWLLPRLGNRSGATYVMLMVTVVIIGIATAVVGKSWRMASIIDKEDELIWRGNEISEAIKGYYMYRSRMHQGAQGAFYPTSLDDLVSDPGRVGYRWLRKKYKDPITGDDFVVIRTNLGIVGVKSSSTDEPLKKSNFREINKDFAGKTRYAEWEFKYVL